MTESMALLRERSNIEQTRDGVHAEGFGDGDGRIRNITTITSALETAGFCLSCDPTPTCAYLSTQASKPIVCTLTTPCLSAC